MQLGSSQAPLGEHAGRSDLLSSHASLLEQTINHENDGSYLYIDKTSKNFVLLFWMFCIGSLLFGFILVGLTPDTYVIKTDSQSQCSNPVIINSDNSLSCQDFDLKTNPKLGIVIKNLSSKNQHFIIDSNYYFQDPNNNTIINQSIRIAQYRLTNDNKIINNVIQQYFDISLNNETRKINMYTNQSKLIGVKSNLLYQHTIVDSNLLVIVQLLNNTNNIKNVTIEGKYVDEKFTKYQNHIRIAFFIKSVLSFFVFICRRRKIPIQKRVIEHKFIMYLGFFLMIFNNPLIAALFPSNNKFLIFLLQLSYLFLPFCLILFWISIFQRGDNENTLQNSEVIHKPFKWILVSLLFIFTLSMYLFNSYQHLKDYFGNEKQKAAFVGLRYTCFFFIIVCYVTISYRVINILMKNRMLRYQRLAIMSIFVIVLSLILFLTIQYGVYSIQQKSMFLMVYFFNVYIYYLQFLYIKTKSPVQLIQNLQLQPLPPTSQNMIVHPGLFTIHDVKKHPFFQQQEQRQQNIIINSSNKQIPPLQQDHLQEFKITRQSQNTDNFEIEDPQQIIKDDIGDIQELGQDLKFEQI